MRLILTLLTALVLVQERPTPPEGWFCQPPGKGVPADHACECQRKCVKNSDCDEEGNCTDAPGMRVTEDPKCKVYCHKDHCGCPSGCQKT